MRKKGMLLIILLMAVGFAAVSTTLFLNGNTDILANQDDFNVYFSDAYVNKKQDKSVIKEDTVIEFNTEFNNIGQEYILDYEVTNGSKNYDAELEMNCVSSSEYLTVTNEFDDNTILESLDTRIGRLIVEQTKSYTGDDLEVTIKCTIDANASERTSLGVLLDQELDIDINDEVNNELEAKAYKVSDNSRDELLTTLIDSKNLEIGTSVRAIVEVQSEDIEEAASIIIDVSDIAQNDDNVIVVYYDDNLKEWNYIGIASVANGKVEFNNIKLIPFAVVNSDGTLGVKLQTVTFNSNSTVVQESVKTVIYNQSIGELPIVSRDGYTFDGWYTEQVNGTKISDTSIITKDETFYAHWIPNQYVVKYDANGGTVNPTSITVTNDLTYGELATPTRTGYTFAGWYTQASGGTKITSSTKVNLTSAQTIYAHWTLNNYTVAINNNGYGTVSASSLSVPYGGTKTFTIAPNAGYYLGSISCTAGYTVSGFVIGAKELPTQTVTVTNNKKDANGVCTVSFSKLWASAEVKNLNSTGYDVYVYQLYNANGISKVSFPTWTTLAGQDDLAASWPTNTTILGTYIGNYTWKYHVNIADHFNEGGEYRTDIYIFDNSGNRSFVTGTGAIVPASGYVNSLYLSDTDGTFNKNKSYSLLTSGTKLYTNFTYEFYALPSRTTPLYTLGSNQAGLTSSTLDWNYIIQEPYGGTTATGYASIGLVIGTNGAMAVAHAGGYYYIVLRYEGDLSARKKYKFVVKNNIPYLYINNTLVATGIEPPGDVTTYFTNGVIGDASYGAYQGFANGFVLYNKAK